MDTDFSGHVRLAPTLTQQLGSTQPPSLESLEVASHSSWIPHAEKCSGNCRNCHYILRCSVTNALEPWQNQLKLPDFEALAHEAAAVNEVKRVTRFSVVIGNPPYSNFGRANDNEWIRSLVSDFRGNLSGESKVNLYDDYIKFLRFAFFQKERAGLGVIGVITNRSFLEGATQREMRNLMLRSASAVRILDLYRGIYDPQSNGDENVFAIVTGVAISIWSSGPISASSKVRFGRLIGSYQDKTRLLSRPDPASLVDTTLVPSAPEYLLIAESARAARQELTLPFPRLFRESTTGVQTNRDALCIDESREVLFRRVQRFAASSAGATSIASEQGISTTSFWNPTDASEKLKSRGVSRAHVYPYLYRPFDERYIYYDDSIVHCPRELVGRALLKKQVLCLLVSRGVDDPLKGVAFVSRQPADKRVLSSFRGEAKLFPVDPVNEARLGLLEAVAPNLVTPKAWPREVGEASATVAAAVYAILNAPSYLGRYSDLLRRDYPQVPIPRTAGVVRELSRLGAALISTHLLESQTLDKPIVGIVGRESREIERVTWSEETVWLDTERTCGLSAVPSRVWNFHIGGYQVCEKWLKDRKGRRLSKEDIEHYQKIVVAISETIRIMKEIDEVIEAHGGWPGAFQTGEARVAVGPALPFRPRTVEPAAEERYVKCVPLVPLKIAAGGFGEAQPALDEGTEWVEVPSRDRLRPGMFVSQVSGRSMEPTIPDGAWCLFTAPVTGSRQGRVVLAQLRDATDPESGERYTVKRYESRKSASDEGWRHEAITLKPDNPEFPPIELAAGDEERLAVVAELVEVLTDPDSGESGKAAAEETTEPPAQPAKRTAWSKQASQRSLLEESGEQLDLGEAADKPEPETVGADRPRADELDRDELVCGLRALFGDGASRSRDEAIRDLARELGFERTGPRVREEIDGAIRAAVRRGVLANERDQLTLQARSIEQYDRDFLKDQFLAALGGTAWIERDKAARALARWMGFRRTGPAIAETVKSLINGLLREGRLEKQDDRVRRVR